MNGKTFRSAAETEERNDMVRLKHQEMQFHAHNCVERPQNRHLKPFKSRAELNGRLDPRINLRGRPKIIREAYEKVLQEKTRVKVKGEDGQVKEIVVPRYEAMARAQVDVACSMKPHSVAAFRAICELVEPKTEEERGSVDKDFVRVISQLIMERPANSIEISSGSNTNGEA
jgi:hypothetical protein